MEASERTQREILAALNDIYSVLRDILGTLQMQS